MTNDFELMEIHIRALFTHDDRSRLLFVNEPNSAVIPASRLFLGRTQAGNVWRFRADLPENLCEELAALCADEPVVEEFGGELPRYAKQYRRLLEQHAPATAEELTTGRAYQFTEPAKQSNAAVVIVTENNQAEILRGGFEDFASEIPDWQPFVAFVENNRAVSICRSARITAEAHEAGVETLPDFRGKGYAAAVTAEWARLVNDAGAMALYSTGWKNHASQAVARKLNLRCYGDDFHID